MARPLVVVLASQKGGVGKTTLAAHLAVAADLAGVGAVAVYDTDPQQSLARWWDKRDAETPHYARGGVDELDATLERLGEKGLRLPVIDTPPAVTGAIQALVGRADFVVVPTKPNMLDLEALGSTVSLVRELGKPFAFALTMVKTGTTVGADGARVLSSFGAVAAIVGDRTGIATSMNRGGTVIEQEPKGRGAEEIGQLWQAVGAATGLVQQRKRTKSHV